MVVQPAKGLLFLQSGGRRLLQKGDAVPIGEKMYMIVGFEVVACSIKREAGQPIRNIPCPQTFDDPNAPAPQEVTRGERFSFFSLGAAARIKFNLVSVSTLSHTAVPSPDPVL